jgi:pimeloyl-ACP methyl ester carboxylesterase
VRGLVDNRAQMHRVDLPSGHIEYSWVGVSEETLAAPLVFLHEGLGCVQMWGRFPHALATAVGRRGLVYSRYGYGGSAPLARPRTERFMDEEALDVLPQVLDCLGVRMPVLVGQSDGASIALIYAASHPAALSGLILEAPHIFAERQTVDGIGLIRARFAGDAEFHEKFGHYHRDARAVVDEWSAAWLSPAFRSWTIEARLPAIICPVLLLQAERDPYGTLEHVDRIARLVRGPVRRVVLPGDGHAPHRDCRARTLSEMTDFLGSVVTS